MSGRPPDRALADELDEVHVVAKAPPSVRNPRWAVVPWFALAALSAVAFVVTYLLWPNDYVSPSEDGHLVFLLQTPVVGGTFGIAVLALGIGVGQYVRTCLPDEIAVQQRHDGPSDEQSRRTAVARWEEVVADTGLANRRFVRRAALGAAGLFGLAAGLLAIGGLVRDPWRAGKRSALRVTGWGSLDGETVYLRTSTGISGEIALVRPSDMEAGAMMTVFPFRESDRGQQELLTAAEHAADAPVMLVRLRPGTPVHHRRGQEDFHYGDFYAFSKVCTHLGCPASQYDAQTNVSLCPCHQSLFSVTEAGRPVFGPAARPLPQLPITVNDEGYFVARGDFVEPVGPTFWEWRAE